MIHQVSCYVATHSKIKENKDLFEFLWVTMFFELQCYKLWSLSFVEWYWYILWSINQFCWVVLLHTMKPWIDLLEKVLSVDRLVIMFTGGPVWWERQAPRDTTTDSIVTTQWSTRGSHPEECTLTMRTYRSLWMGRWVRLMPCSNLLIRSWCPSKDR